MHNRLSLVSWISTIFLLGLLVVSARAQPPQPAEAGPAPVPIPREKDIPLAQRLHSPRETDRPLADKLASPRETLKTLYFAVITYDLFPEMIHDAVACLDLDELQPRPTPEDAALLALDLEQVLQVLALPLCSAPDQEAGNRVLLHDGAGFTVALQRGPDHAWRFDAQTLRQLPVMRRAARERSRQRTVDLNAVREGFTDPRATLRHFVSDTAYGDFYAAAQALDLSALSDQQRREQGPILAQQLAFIQQRRGYLFRQEVPDQPDGPPYTWRADPHGRITLERVRQPDGKEAWLFNRQTVRNIPRMYAAVQALPPDSHYVRLGMIVPALQNTALPATRKRPEEVPPHLGSPRDLLQGFFRTLDAADTNDARLTEALEYLDLDNVPLAERAVLGGKLAIQLEAVLRKLSLDLSTVPSDWNSPAQILGESQGVRIEILRQRDGCWRISKATVGRVPEMFDKLAGKSRTETGRGSQLDSARDTLITFQAAAGHRDFALAANCLNLSEIHTSAREELGPVLAFKLKYVIDRLGRIYIQEISDNPDGPRYVLYRGELGRIVLDRQRDNHDKSSWQFNPETVHHIETMFRGVLGRSPDESQKDSAMLLAATSFWEMPGPWLRLQLPGWTEVRLGRLDLYQWLGLGLTVLASWVGARLTLLVVSWLVTWVLRRSGSALSISFVAATLKPCTWLAAVWIFFLLLGVLDLPVAVASEVFAAKKFLLAAMFAWVCMRLMDLSMGVYTNSELLRPHRNLGDMIVPVAMRLGKTTVVLVVAAYMIYQVGEIDLLGRFLTGLGVAGLAASLAAQDALKSFFGTLLLIGERVFRIGDRISVGDIEGVVEQVGFRSTRLRTDEGTLLTVPNSVIAASAINNLGARSHLRFSSTVEVSPETAAERILEFRDRLQGWLTEQALVIRDKVGCQVHHTAYRGVELQLSLFLATQKGAEESRFRAGVSREILRLAGELEVGISPSCRRLLLEADSARDAVGPIPQAA